MKPPVLLTLLFLALCTHAQEATVTWEEIVESATTWARDNIDPDVLKTVEQSDPEAGSRFLTNMQSQLQGEYVVDLAQWRDAARMVLPLLESNAGTAPYAAWVKARLDYLEVANELRLRIPPPAQGSSTRNPATAPTAAAERTLWREKLSTRAWPDQARAYIPQLKPVFARQKVPPELVWIAEVESSFNPAARSPAGAVGLFQLMPSTATQYGLALTPEDQRMHPEPSATAAARHLAYLFERFKDWRLALAAYNAGEGRVQRLLDAQRAGTFDEIAPRLPAETQMYVPRIEAVLLRREGRTLDQLALPDRTVEAASTE
jgi:membrane-bound lytic murein transglycosylase D